MRLTALVFAIVTFVLCSCSQFKASPAPDSGFLQNASEMKERRERYPFNRVWVSPEFKQNRDRYTSIIVAPVNMTYLEKMDWWQRQSAVTQEGLNKDVQTIAAYMHKAFTDAIANDPNRRLKVVNASRPNTLVLELALVELVPNKAFFNAATTVGGFFVPGLGMAATAGKGSVAIEGRVRDAQTGKVMAQMADREEGQSAMVDVAGMTWYSSAKNSIDDWAGQFVELANSDLTFKVRDTLPFTLATW